MKRNIRVATSCGGEGEARTRQFPSRTNFRRLFRLQNIRLRQDPRRKHVCSMLLCEGGKAVGSFPGGIANVCVKAVQR